MCPRCNSSATAVIESRKCSNGSQRRRHMCHACGHRWTLHLGPPPGHRGGLRKGQLPAQRPTMTPDEVRFILLSPDSTRAVAKQIGRSCEAVRQVRANLIHKTVHPKIQRIQRVQHWNRPPVKPPAADGPTCDSCVHWADRCTFGYPDPLLEGLGFAADCSMYES